MSVVGITSTKELIWRTRRRFFIKLGFTEYEAWLVVAVALNVLGLALLLLGDWLGGKLDSRHCLGTIGEATLTAELVSTAGAVTPDSVVPASTRHTLGETTSSGSDR